MFLCLAAACQAQTLPPRVEKILSWLPEDTETIFVANKPFVISAYEKRRADDQTEPQLGLMFQSMAVRLFGMQDGLLQNFLAGQRVEVAIEGSRKFRPPSGLGSMRYEGCNIAVFAEENGQRGEAFLTQAAKAAVRTDALLGQKILVFRQKLEDDQWTIFVTFPRPDVVLACSDLEYLSGVLERIGGKVAPRALNATLPEWKYVKTDAPFWALRHYSKNPGMDPTSPFMGADVAPILDSKAVGISFSLDSGSDNAAAIVYFSSGDGLLELLKETPLSMEELSEEKDLPVNFKEIAPATVEIRYETGKKLPPSLLMFVVTGLLGHAVYL